MPSIRELYINHVAQTSEIPMMLEIDRAEGMYMYSTDGQRYLDLNSGISVSSLGHRHPNVINAVKDQLDKHLHTMVYGEHIHTPQVAFAELLTKVLDNGLDSVYYLTSGTEAVEGAMKLARKYTGRYEIIACSNAYHGSTMGSESLRSDDEFTRSFLPGVPGVRHIDFNDEDQLTKINENTACIILEPVQAEGGVKPPKDNYLQKVRNRCNEVGALMILDEIQTGFGRTGNIFAHKKYDVVPDVLLMGKAMGGGMPVSAFVAPKEIMMALAKKPMLGHITTFGGHPVCVAAALATLQTLTDEEIYQDVIRKEELIRSKLKHPIIKEIRSSGLMMGVELTRRKYLKHVVNHTIKNGALIDYFLFNNKSFRLAPPLIINDEQIEEGCGILLAAMDHARFKYTKR
ncbi:MAG: acetylornithine/succinyldiaminopimelate/putrescine aminotransferase [Saprospiraceae bacterium]|jgi:acetylornithine/succinyldiaminopimelate/putrescine aminotransferase